MTVYYRANAFVFKKRDSAESDRFFSVFTDSFGRIELFGKAIRKIASKLRGGIDLFFLSEVEFIQGKNHKTLTDALAVKKFPGILKDLSKLAAAHKISEAIDNLLSGQEKDNKIWELLNKTFEKLEECSTSKAKIIFYFFLWNALSYLGYRPHIEECPCCHAKITPYGIYFSNKEGGVICKKCLLKEQGAKKINSDIVKLLKIILKEDWETILKIRMEESSWKLFQEISDNYYSYLNLCHKKQFF